MSKEILENMQPGAIGGAKDKLEKQARQLAYDTKYKVKQTLSAKSGGSVDPATVSKLYLAQLSKSPAPPAVKALAKKKLMGEEYTDIKELVVDCVTDALLKVFVEKAEEITDKVIAEESDEKKFHIKVTDKKTGNSYHRYATRAKISELRANSNIATVEMSHQGENETKAKKDHDGDGKVESPSKEHAGAVHNAIQKAKGGTPDGQDTRKEAVEEPKIGGGNLKKLSKKATKRIDADVDGDVDTDDMKSKEMGEFIPSPDGKKKIKPMVQKEEFSDWKNDLFETKDEIDNEKEIDVLKKGKKNIIKVMPPLGEGVEPCPKCGKSPCECDKKKSDEDPRGMATKINLVRNKLRAMGLKMSHVPEGDMIEEVKPEKETEKKTGPSPEEQQMIAKKRQMMLKTQMIQKQKLNLQKQGKLPITSEATEDSLRDRRMERGGVDGNNRYNKPVSNTPNTFGKKKPKYDGMSALEKVKASIRAKHGDGAIIDTKKKKD
jgi:hypothetical protein